MGLRERNRLLSGGSHKSFRPKDGSDDGDGTNFHGQKRSNKTHESTTDPESRLYKKSYGTESNLAYLDWVFVFSCAAHNLLRLPKLTAQQAA